MKSLILIVGMTAVLVAGCVSSPSPAPQAMAPETSLDLAGQGLGWLDIRYMVDPSDSHDASLTLALEYGAPVNWPTAKVYFIGADVSGQIQQEHIKQLGTTSWSNGSAREGRATLFLAGQDIETRLPALPGAAAATARANLPEVDTYQLASLRDECIVVVAPGEVCHLFWVFYGGSPSAGFEISANWTGAPPLIEHGLTSDTFAFSMENFRAEHGLGYELAGLEGAVATNLYTNATLGRPDQRVLLAFLGRGNFNLVGQPVGQAFYTTPGGEQRTVGGDGVAVEVSPVGGEWTFGMTSSIDPAKTQGPVVWGAVVGGFGQSAR